VGRAFQPSPCHIAHTRGAAAKGGKWLSQTTMSAPNRATASRVVALSRSSNVALRGRKRAIGARWKLSGSSVTSSSSHSGLASR
jgi:hypothetical protein